MARPNPYGGGKPNPDGRVGQQQPKGRVNGRRPLDFAPANLVHRTRGIGTFTLTGQPSDGETVTITNNEGDSQVFEFDDDVSVAAGNNAVTIGGSAAATADNLWTAILVWTAQLGVQPIRFTAGGGDEIVGIVAAGPKGIGATLEEAASNLTVDPMHGDVDHGSPKVLSMSRQPTTEELASGVMLFPTDFTIRGHLLAIRDGSNVLKAFDGSSSSDGLFGTVVVDNDGASTPFASGDTVSVLAWGENVAYEDTVVFD